MPPPVKPWLGMDSPIEDPKDALFDATNIKKWKNSSASGDANDIVLIAFKTVGGVQKYLIYDDSTGLLAISA